MTLPEPGKPAKCARCGHKSSKSFSGGFCKSCFRLIIEGRISKNIRGQLKNNLNVLFLSKSDWKIVKSLTEIKFRPFFAKPGSFNANSLLELAHSREMAEFARKNSIQKIMLPWTTTTEAALFLQNFLHSANFRSEAAKLALPSQFVKMYLYVSDNELSEYFSIMGIKEKPHTSAGKLEAYALLKSLEKIQPDAGHGIAKSSLEMQEILIKNG